MAKDREQFDDPAMKSLLRKVWGREKAPDALRSRVAASLADASKPVARKSSPGWVRYAVAAMVLVAVGYAYMSWREYQAENQPTVLAYHLPSGLKSAMVTAHQSDTSTMDQSALAGTREMTLIDQRLTTALGKAVLATDLPGWKFVGAGMVDLGGQKAARLVFTQDGVTASVFSIIAPSDCGGTNGTTYEEMHQNVAIAGILKDGAIYCILASPGNEQRLKAITSLRDELSGKI